MIAPGTPSSLNGKKPSVRSSEESQFLYLINNSIQNLAGILAATEGTIPYNTPALLTLSSGSSAVFASDTTHAISIIPIIGTVSVTIGTSTPVIYPVGSSINLQATTTFSYDITITASAGGSDYTLINTMA